MADGLLGFVGGVLGGLAGLSGPVPTIWASLSDWTKAEKRGVIQDFNLTLLTAAAVAHDEWQEPSASTYLASR